MTRAAVTRAVVLHQEVAAGAGADEREVLDQAAAVATALRELGHEAVLLPFGADLAAAAAALDAAAPQVAFNLVESVGGEDLLLALAPALLELKSVPYTGAPLAAALRTSSKLKMKAELRAAGLPTPPSCDQSGAVQGGELGARVLLKPAWEHASKFLDEDSVIANPGPAALADLLGGLQRRHRRPFFAERYVHGREFNLSLLGGRPAAGAGLPEGRGGVELLPAAEILFQGYGPGKPRVVGWKAKWEPDSFEYQHTVRSFDFGAADRPLLQLLAELARACWDCFGLRGYARVDLRVDEGGSPWIVDVNLNPSLAPDAGFAAALARAGISFSAAVARILEDAQ